ncbi:outer membrane protein [Aquabacter spiritensis]|uniref:Opacity protein-like surface antigen n=1 Tax=Aquabacter spiritensis TaxID=933073 RepID=A0A4R3M9F2_9HYPH|nr:outer membrane beta-barrel protein [Aquabacter spiritensis]TCT08005.1 hypothetical protein EDC64_101524 [Aquabacter spiritensis]
MSKRSIVLSICLAAWPLVAQAQEAQQAQQASGAMPANGIFIGAGGAFNGATFPNQDIFGFGISDVYALGHWVARGQAGGSAYPNLGTDSSLAPALQLGFYRTVAGTPWVWGAKFSYNQVGVSGAQDNVLIPQAGSYDGLISGTFNGNYLLRSYQMSLEHQFALVPLVGYSFGRGFVYGGAGPTLSKVTASMNGLIGFAELDHRFDVSGTPGFFSASNWVWGATAMAGVTYFFAPSWFLDLSYSYTASATSTNTFANQFDTVYPTTAFSGLSAGTYSGTVDNQALTVTINYVF